MPDDVPRLVLEEREEDVEALKILIQRVRESVTYRRYTDSDDVVLEAARHLAQRIEE